jgi:hypothetical protein
MALNLIAPNGPASAVAAGPGPRPAPVMTRSANSAPAPCFPFKILMRLPGSRRPAPSSSRRQATPQGPGQPDVDPAAVVFARGQSLTARDLAAVAAARTAVARLAGAPRSGRTASSGTKPS